MKTKKCYRCKTVLPVTEFYPGKRTKDKLFSWCKKCKSEHANNHYKKNKERYLKVQKQRVSKNILFIFKFLKENPCVDCGETNTVVLEFDHVKGIKEYNVSSLIRDGNRNRIIREIKKCEVVCSNCHRIRTAKKFNWELLKLENTPLVSPLSSKQMKG